MQRTPVKSSNILSVGYAEDSRTLEVEFPGSVYQYKGVGPEVHADMLKAESVGKYFAANIRGKFDAVKTDEKQAASQ